MIHKLLAVFLSLAVVSVSFAADEVPEATTEAAVEEPSKPWSIGASLTVPTAYIFRGYNFGDSDIQLQPEITGEYELQVGDLTLRPHGEAWANVVPDGDEVGTFNELDLSGGVAVDLPAKFSLDFVYIFYTSPADDFDDVHEVGIVASHDDPLQPHVGLYREVDGSSVTEDGSEATYLEVGVEPEIPWHKMEKLTVTVPVTLGMGFDDYYVDSDGDNTLFGYVSAGLTASYALTDNLSLDAGVAFYTFLADSTESANHGTDYKVVGEFGVSLSF